ncbi:Dyp-type peroxidase [Tomitella biformata]|uniref:Dyp-type peroxidase n=1 Tax=Tomitella biformata TaxID=630403 RepID=UPI0004BB7D4A|nr:Dyp-type peroxidase [Tomitella biformata]
MADPQSGTTAQSLSARQQAAIPQAVTTALTPAAIFLVVTVESGGEDAVRDLLPTLASLRKTSGFRVPEAELEVVVGIGARLWPRLFSAVPPAELHPFTPLDGDRHSAPSTPGDLLFHLRANSLDACYALATQIMGKLRGNATVIDEVHGFRYFDRRDLLGFVDGTENPDGQAAVDATTIGDEDPQYRSGSYVIVQKYLHDMSAWDALSIDEQQRVIGRTKADDVEFDDPPANSHVALNSDITDDAGNDLDILRVNMPFGSIGEDEHGTYFIGYAARADTIERMLRNMFLGDPPGNYDRILDFSTAVTGSLYFVPTVDFLDKLPPAPGTSDAPEASSASTPPSDGSLGIGSLRRSTNR